MAENVFENWQQAMQTIVQTQQEMFRKWVDLWTGMPLLTLELWSKSFDYLRQAGETQLREFQAAMQKCSEGVAKSKAA
jgi:hypothetical protein